MSINTQQFIMENLQTDTAASAQAGAYFPSEFASCLVSHGPCFSKGGGGGGDDIFEKCQDWTQLYLNLENSVLSLKIQLGTGFLVLQRISITRLLSAPGIAGNVCGFSRTNISLLWSPSWTLWSHFGYFDVRMKMRESFVFKALWGFDGPGYICILT
ncbi:uncharacterized protein BT62DRAFT_999740 [Guyanagaster necrorhizus]|uniref:Uncharacterized protein n=1 Tax=Guyanagaster necrorhizus TaxID=856835 RepID=A0A9P8AXV6_9AGAR|nr:uncharacterized protein BT62DRAFT_999740 [Guyanagaster necrorhizus MCA 3950]KAG7451998.1 hypothetical protein BT62DRAFT_999740 [Guyanagaster necrorhizus MCA 3950]